MEKNHDQSTAKPTEDRSTSKFCRIAAFHAPAVINCKWLESWSRSGKRFYFGQNSFDHKTIEKKRILQMYCTTDKYPILLELFSRNLSEAIPQLMGLDIHFLDANTYAHNIDISPCFPCSQFPRSRFQRNLINNPQSGSAGIFLAKRDRCKHPPQPFD